MTNWVAPEFVEIRMDAEINCYSSALDDNGRRPIPNNEAGIDKIIEPPQE